MQLSTRLELPFTTITITYQGLQKLLPHVLIDTGSARTILAADVVADVRIVPAPNDVLYTIRGVGGTETVYSRHLDEVLVGDRHLANFEVEIGGMDYGFEIQGILGMDFLRQTGAVLDLGAMTISFPSPG